MPSMSNKGPFAPADVAPHATTDAAVVVVVNALFTPNNNNNKTQH